MTVSTEISQPVAPKKETPLDDNAKLKLQRVVKDFEAILVGHMLKSMRGTLEEGGMFGDSFGGDMLSGMFDSELAKHVSQHSALGLAEMMYRQITGEKLPRTSTQNPQITMHTMSPTQQTPMKTGSSKSVHERVERFDGLIQSAAARHNLDPHVLKAVMASESAGKPDARSSKNAKGLMQLIDSTATEMGVTDIWNPKENIEGGAKYLRQMLDRFDGDLRLALASYNAGPAAVEKHNGIPPFQETNTYIARVLRYITYYQQESQSQ
jgi:Rod binding domain-containing protein